MQVWLVDKKRLYLHYLAVTDGLETVLSLSWSPDLVMYLMVIALTVLLCITATTNLRGSGRPDGRSLKCYTATGPRQGTSFHIHLLGYNEQFRHICRHLNPGRQR